MKKLTSGIVFALMAVLFAGMFITPPAYAQEEMYVEPATNPPAPGPYLGFSWNVSVWVKNVAEEIQAFQFLMVIDPDENILNITGAWLPVWDPDYVFSGISTVCPSPSFNDLDTDGYIESVLVGDSILVGTPPAGPGPYLLGLVEFTIMEAPEKYETLSCDLTIDNLDTYILNPDLDKRHPIKTGATYEWAWTPPAYNPYLEAVPSQDLFESYKVWNCTYFTVDIYIRELAVEWVLHNASFKLTYNGTLTETEAANITIAPEWLTSSVSVTPGDPGEIAIFVEDYVTPPPSGDVLVATIKFHIIGQGASPPRTAGDYDESVLDFYDVLLMDTYGPITTEPHIGAVIRVECYVALPLPYMEVVPNDTVMGPDLVVGDQYAKNFQIEVWIKNVSEYWFMVGIQFRLSFDESIVDVVSIEEGSFLPQFNNTPTPPYTYFISYVEYNDPVYGTHVLVGDLLLPNATGDWNVFPKGEGPVAIITFKPLVQSWTETYYDEFNFIEVVFADKEAKPITPGTSINGTYTCLPIEAVGPVIDVWMQYPAPFGGQGLMQPADLVVPQQLLCLTAKVTYNWWPVPQKLVTFWIYDDDGNLVTDLQGMTDDYGHVTECFRMPFYDAEDYFGVWYVNATVSVCEEVVYDIMEFHFDWLVRIWKVTTDKEEYAHLETVEITVEYGSHAQQYYDLVLKIAMFDNQSYPIGLVYADITVGGATFCEYKNYTTTLTITIPWWAAAGQATIEVHFIEHLGGVAVTPEATKKVWILPL